MGSIFVGYLTHDMFIGLGSDFFNNSIYILPKNVTLLDSEFIPFYIKLIPIYFTFFGIFISFLFNYKYSYKITKIILINKKIYSIYTIINKKFFFDKIYNYFIARKFLNLGYHISFKLIDKGILENLGPNFFYNKMLYYMYKYTVYNNKLNSFIIYFSSITLTIFFFILLLFLFIL